MKKLKKIRAGCSNLQGFTLIEVIIVVLLIVLVTGVFGGFYLGTYKHLKVKDVARKFFLTAKYAKLAAIENQRNFRLMVDANSNSFGLTTELMNQQSGQLEQAEFKNMYSRPVKLAEGIRFEKVLIEPAEGERMGDSGDAILFSPDGTSQAAVVQIGDGKNHYTINICAATAKPKIYEGLADEAGSGVIDLDRK